MRKQSELEKIAIEERKKLLPLNTYDKDDRYSSQHTRALLDEETPEYGKGTGKSMDFNNGGSSVDINGVEGMIGTGRISQLAMNQYNYDNGYTKPDTSLNEGQIIL